MQKWLVDRLHVPFDRRADGQLDLALEAAHSLPRILHATDRTGAAIEQALLAEVREQRGIRIVVGSQGVDVLTTHHQSRRAEDRYALENPAVGAYLAGGWDGRVCTVIAGATVLATGGAGALYIHSSNDPGSIGSGVAMASRAGAACSNSSSSSSIPRACTCPARRVSSSPRRCAARGPASSTMTASASWSAPPLGGTGAARRRGARDRGRNAPHRLGVRVSGPRGQG